MAPIEQTKYKRAGTGLRGIDVDRACPGYVLFAHQTDRDNAAVLIDLQGNVVHTWKAPYPGMYAYLSENGTLIYNARTADKEKRWISDQPWKTGVVVAMDWNSRVLWEIQHPDLHHDGILLRNGNVLLPCLRPVPAELAPLIKGGRPGTESNGEIYADYLVEMTTAGEVVWEWRSWEHLNPAADGITAIQDERSGWTHINCLVELPDRNILVTCRAISRVFVLERSTGKIIWMLGSPPLAQPHASVPLPDGNFLIFDNGVHRLDDGFPWSRVIEVNRDTQEIGWTYREALPFNFYSPHSGNAQRLPNGNTFINEGAFGRFFEVTPEKEVVWEYVNPYFASANPHMPDQNGVFRAYHYSEEEIARARAAAG